VRGADGAARRPDPLPQAPLLGQSGPTLRRQAELAPGRTEHHPGRISFAHQYEPVTGSETSALAEAPAPYRVKRAAVKTA